MKYISPDDSSDWLRLHGIIESPYSAKPSTISYKQHSAPQTLSLMDSLLRRLVESNAALLVFNDWVFYPSDDWKYYKLHQIGFVEAMKDIATRYPDFSKGIARIYDANESAGIDFAHQY